MKRLTVLFDAGCGLCTRSRRWLEAQPALLELAFLAAGSDEARRLYPTLRHADPPAELVVVDDEGGVYREHDAWIMCLYALENYRAWSLRLASPALRHLSRSAFEWLSRHRRGLSRHLLRASHATLVQTFGSAPRACARPACPTPEPGGGAR